MPLFMDLTNHQREFGVLNFVSGRLIHGWLQLTCMFRSMFNVESRSSALIQRASRVVVG